MPTTGTAAATSNQRDEPATSGSARFRRILSLADFEQAARRRLPSTVFTFLSSGAEEQRSLAQNRDAFRDIDLVPRVLVDVSRRGTTTSLFGRTYAAPFGIAPLGIAALSAYRADVVLARAARRAGIPMVLSGSSLIRLEEVGADGERPWFQAYLPGDPQRNESLVERVERAGYEVLVVTLDTPVAANRENDERAGFAIPLRPGPRLIWDGVSHPRWLLGTFLRTLLRHGMPHFENSYAARGVPILSPGAVRAFSERGHLTWRHLEQVRRSWKSTLIVKGVLAPDDARRAAGCGVDGIIVSNHGGRQLDGAIAPLRALPWIVAACPALPVMLDGGVRRGTDALKALALGARFVFVGRPFIYAAAVGGEAGVRHAAALLASEIHRDMGLLGITDLARIDAGYLHRRDGASSTSGPARIGADEGHG